MDDVKRYGMSGFGGGMIEIDDGPFVVAEDFDAQRLRADTAEAERDDLKNEVGQVKGEYDRAVNKLASAEQRIAELDSQNTRLEILLRRASNYGGLTPDWHDAVQLILAEQKENLAAINPKPKEVSHDRISD